MRRYSTRLMVNMAGYFVLLVAAVEAYQRGWSAGPFGYVLAIVPALPILGLFVLYARYFREETDEVQRAMVMTSLVWSGAASLCEATVWGFLEMFGKAPHIFLWIVPVAFFAQIAITGPLAARRFQ
jgi:quinol-cytochrome oxidoreductase complex cytochrome b subunit